MYNPWLDGRALHSIHVLNDFSTKRGGDKNPQSCSPVGGPQDQILPLAASKDAGYRERNHTISHDLTQSHMISHNGHITEEGGHNDTT